MLLNPMEIIPASVPLRQAVGPDAGGEQLTSGDELKNVDNLLLADSNSLAGDRKPNEHHEEPENFVDGSSVHR